MCVQEVSYPCWGAKKAESDGQLQLSIRFIHLGYPPRFFTASFSLLRVGIQYRPAYKKHYGSKPYPERQREVYAIRNSNIQMRYAANESNFLLDPTS